MPRLKQVSRAEAGENVLKYYNALFGDRDPVADPGTATGTPGNWWTVFALVPYVFDHATSHFGMFGMFADKSVSQLDGKVRELAIMRAGYAQGSQFVFSQHCKAARRFGISDEQIEAIPYWEVSDVFDAKERAVLAWADALILQGGRASDELFEALKVASLGRGHPGADLSHHGLQPARGLLQGAPARVRRRGRAHP